jgi:hypothetical protein
MSQRVAVGLALLGLALSGALEACKHSPHDGTLGMCPQPAPAFRLTLWAQPALPLGASLRVGFGGAQTESYELGGREGHNETACCAAFVDASGAPERIACGGTRPDTAASSDAGRTPARVIVCDLWTDGAAEIVVRAKGFPTLKESLVAQRAAEMEGCHTLVTVDVQRALSHTDAGD